MFKMEYNNFIKTSLAKIKTSRSALAGVELITDISPIPSQPTNLYIELLVEKNHNLCKI